MSELGYELVHSAQSRIGAPFQHHFKPKNLCSGGAATIDQCMERGLDRRGYDCSGLAIASICDVVGMAPTDWPRQLRHTKQLATHAIDTVPQPGDLRLYYDKRGRIHLGVATTTEEVIHASGLPDVNRVEQGLVAGEFEAIRSIAIESLYKIVRHG